MADEQLTGYARTPDLDQVGDRYDRFVELRSGGPVIRREGFVITTTWAAADEVFRHPEKFSNKWPSIGNARPMIPINNDPPEHRHYRRYLDPLFAPKAIMHLNEQITEITNRRIDSFIDKGWCHFDGEFAVPVPSEVFLRLMGLPMEELDLLLELKDGILRPGYREGITDPEAVTKLQNDTGERVYAYFQAVIDDRRAHPETQDMMQAMMTAELDGVRLTDDEIVDICFLMLIAGLDTITNSLTLFYTQFLQRPDLRQQIVDNPACIPNAVEELLRWETPTPAVPRIVMADGELMGCPVFKGDMVSVDLGAADTDPTYITDAAQLRFDRDVNIHYAFSGGVHRCIGSYLARQELRIVLAEWHRRIPEYRQRPGHEPVWPPGLRSVENIFLEWS
jgi:cytochrome P450